MLLLMFVVAWAFLIPAALAGVPLIPFPLLGAIFLGQLGPAVLVTWAGGGGPAVRKLFGQVFRWRVQLAWYLFALFASGRVTAVDRCAFRRRGGACAVHQSVGHRELPSALTILPIVSLWEEMAWMGVVQARLATYLGPVLAAVITGPLFGLLHMPLELGQPFGSFFLTMAALMVLGSRFGCSSAGCTTRPAAAS